MSVDRVHGPRRSSGGSAILLLVGLMLGVWQVGPLGAQDADKEAVREASRRFSRAERLHDPDSLRAILWEDAEGEVVLSAVAVRLVRP